MYRRGFSVSHVSVLDILPVHEHVLSAQRPHLALAGQHVALKHISAVSVHLRRGDGVDAVLLEARHRLSDGEGTEMGEEDRQE